MKTRFPLLEVNQFSLSFRSYQKGLEETELTVVKNLNMAISEGEIVAIVGASGSGKSLLAHAILGILPDHASWQGSISYRGREMTDSLLKELRGKEIALIPQSIQSLNPLMKVGKQVQEVASTSNDQLQEMFARVGLPKETINQYPFELSGGMARRVLTLIAMTSSAQLIIADEPTPGLDPAILQETTIVLRELAAEGKGIVFISHDIRTALSIADKVIVFNRGETIEEAKVDVFSGNGEKLKQDFTKKLWNALPENRFFVREKTSLYNKRPESNQLEVKNLSYKYKKGPYLFQNLSLTIQPGEIVGMHGYSGTGKTTLAKVLAGYIEPLEGAVKIGQQKYRKHQVNPVQLVWQHPEKAINSRWKMEKVLAESDMVGSPLLDELGIEQEWLGRWPSELSGGELQRFCLARALHNDTKFLIADEMTTMLDAITQAKLWETVCRLAAERQIGVLAISHDHKLLNRISDRILDFQDMK